MIMSIIRSTRNPRLPQLQPLSARYNLIKKEEEEEKRIEALQRVLSEPALKAPLHANGLREIGAC